MIGQYECKTVALTYIEEGRVLLYYQMRMSQTGYKRAEGDKSFGKQPPVLEDQIFIACYICCFPVITLLTA